MSHHCNIAKYDVKQQPPIHPILPDLSVSYCHDTSSITWRTFIVSVNFSHTSRTTWRFLTKLGMDKIYSPTQISYFSCFSKPESKAHVRHCVNSLVLHPFLSKLVKIFTSSLKPLQGFQWNVKGSKSPMSSLKVCSCWTDFTMDASRAGNLHPRQIKSLKTYFCRTASWIEQT